MTRKNSRLGRDFGRLTTLEWLPKIKSYKCKCICGTLKIIKSAQLGLGDKKGTRSCGCLKVEEWAKRGGSKRLMRLNEIQRYYRRNARVRNYSWELTSAEFETASIQPCTYCNEIGSLGFSFTGIDRIDNNLGYTPSNIIPCCKRCNQARNNMSVTEFTSWVKKVYIHLQKKEALNATGSCPQRQ